MVKVSKGAAHISRYNILLSQASLHINILYPESTEGAFDALIIFIIRKKYKNPFQNALFERHIVDFVYLSTSVLGKGYCTLFIK